MPAYDIGPKIGIEGEKEFRNSIKAIDSELRALGNELKTLSKEYDENDRSIEGVTRKQNTLNQAIETSRKRIDLLTSQYNKQVQELKRLESALDTARRTNGENSDEALKAEQAYARQAKTVNDLGSRLEQARGQMLTFQSQLEALGNGAIRAGDQLQTAGDKISGFGGKLSSLGNTLTMGVTTPILAIGTAAVTMGNDFEAQMSRVQAIAGATADQMEGLNAQALQLGADTSFSASEVAQGMENLASAGFSVDEIMSAMPGMLDLAASSGADLATASEIAASSLRGFGLDASEASHVADVFATAAARTNAQTEDLGEAMKYIAPVANAMGQSLEETAAAVGIMSDAGIKGTQAGTSLRGALSRLAKPTAAMQTTMEDLGVSFYNAQGEMLPLNQIIEQLEGSFEGLTQEQQNNALVTLFGQESLSGMLALIQRGPDELRSMTASFEDASGAAKEMADTMLDNTAGSIEEMMGSIETAGITIQKVLAPHIRDAAEAVTDLFNEFSDLDEEQQKNIVTWTGVAAAAGPAVKILGTATTGIGKLTKGVGTIVSDLGKLSQSGWKATDAMSGFGKLVGTLASPGGAIALGAVAVAGIGAAALAARDQLVQADMEGRFGDMVLSMEEVEDAAQRLTTTDWTLRVDAYVDAQAELDQAFSTLEEAQKELEKQAWKVSVKMELTEEDVGAFQSAVDGYVQSAIAAVEESSYTAQVAVSAVFLPGSEAGAAVQAYSSAFYAETQGELTALGDDLSVLVDKALADGILSHQELMDIGAIQSRMQDLLDKIADRNYQVELKQLELTAGGAALSVESFRGILDEGGQILETRLENLQSVTANVEVQLEAMLAQGEIDQATFARWKQEMEASLAGQTAEATLPLVQLGVEQIETNYSDVIGRAKEEFQERLNEAFSKMEADPGQVDWFNKLWSEFEWNFQISDDKARAGVSQLMQAMQPEKEALEALRQQYVEAGRIPPESLTEGLANIYSLEQMSGAADNTFALMAHAIAESPRRQEAVAQALLAGQELDASLAQALRDNYGLIWDANQGTWKQLKESNALAAAEVAGFLNQYGAMFGDTFCQSMASKYGLVYENGQYLVKNVAQGVHDESPTLLMEGEQLAANTVGVMDSTISGSTVGPPSVAAPDGYTAGYNYMAELQYYLDTHPATVSVGMSGPAAMKMLGYESGGIVEEPQIAAIAENGAEAVIPLERHPARALALWQEAGERLNAFAADEGRGMGSARRAQMVTQNTDNHREFHIEEGAVVVHTQATDGKTIYREIVREMQKEVKRKEAAYGGF